MAKKTKKTKKQRHKHYHKINENISPVLSYRNLIYGIIFVFSFVIYANSIPNEYALDDIYVIYKNNFTKEGINGIGDILSSNFFAGFLGNKKIELEGGRYRPFSIVTFAIEYHFFGEKPHVNHFFNVLFYMLTGIVLFKILLKFFASKKYYPFDKKWYLSLPFVITMIYLAHPIHTEVIANIKGRDEIFALLFSLLSLFYVIYYFEHEKNKYLIFSTLYFFLALMSKEIAIVFVPLIPLICYTFRIDKKNKKDRKKKWIYSMAGIVSATVIFLIIRQIVISDTVVQKVSENLMNNPFLEATTAEKFATIFYTLGLYLKLTFIPHPLTIDYYPYHIPLVNFANPLVLLSIVIYLAMGAYAAWGVFKRSVVALGIIMYLIPLSITANILFPIGTFMNERFLYISSLGMIIAGAFILFYKIPILLTKKEGTFRKKYPVLLLLMTLVILTLFSIKTIARNNAWEDDFTLYKTDVKTSTNSAKIHDDVGKFMAQEARKLKDPKTKQEMQKKAIFHLRKALEIYPNYEYAMLDLAVAYYDYNQNFDSIAYYYKRLLKLMPKHTLVHKNITMMLQNYNNIDHKIRILKDIEEITPNNYLTIFHLGLAYGQEKNLPKTIEYFEKAKSIQPQNHSIYKNLGTAYFLQKKYTKAIKTLEYASKLNPKDADIRQKLLIIYQKTENQHKIDSLKKIK